jgi:Mrp family chromosome partitioning ATPase
MAAQHPLRSIQKVKNLIAVASGKGGVGKIPSPST